MAVSGPPDPVVVDGPWVQGFFVDVPVPLVSKSNARRYRRGSAPVRSDSSFESSVGLIVRSVRPAGWDAGDPSDALADRPSLVVVISARSLLDAGNFSKSVLDALEGVLYVNDASVRSVCCFAERGRSDGFRLAAARLDGSASLKELARASAVLGEVVVG